MKYYVICLLVVCQVFMSFGDMKIIVNSEKFWDKILIIRLWSLETTQSRNLVLGETNKTNKNIKLGSLQFICV